MRFRGQALCAAAVAAAVSLLSANTVAGDAIVVKTHMLKNGMKVMVHEDPAIPNVAMYIYFRIGSRNERPGITGVSHFFGHMMFNGTKICTHQEARG